MAPKVKVLESNDLGHGVFYEVRPAAKGNPTVQVIVDGERLPAFRRRPDSSAQEQVRGLAAVKAKLFNATDAEPGAAPSVAVYFHSLLLSAGALHHWSVARQMDALDSLLGLDLSGTCPLLVSFGASRFPCFFRRRTACPNPGIFPSLGEN